ncbi:MAG: helix-turn-helix transcriptional regulator [Lachnospiraceae bacterium]|nr:helix-turn-helix transcriptional regulator [Lachnospiraceae bacterium]
MAQAIGIGSQIKHLRKACGYTQQELADKLDVTKSIVSAYEQEKRCPSYMKLIELATFFNVSTDYLLGVERDNSLDLSGLTPDAQNAVKNLVATLK